MAVAFAPSIARTPRTPIVDSATKRVYTEAHRRTDEIEALSHAFQRAVRLDTVAGTVDVFELRQRLAESDR